jgi:hypothetical protein
MVVITSQISLGVHVFGTGKSNACRMFVENLLGNVHFKRLEVEYGHNVGNGGPWL